MRAIAVAVALGAAFLPIVDATTHMVFDSGHGGHSLIRPGQTWEHRFDRVGTYTYHTYANQSMRGSVLVYEEAPAANTVTVSITANGFVPDQVSVRPRATVIWRNDDSVNHSVTEDAFSPGPDQPPYGTTDPQAPGGDSPAPAGVGLIAIAASIALWRRSRHK